MMESSVVYPKDIDKRFSKHKHRLVCSKASFTLNNCSLNVKFLQHKNAKTNDNIF